MVTSRSTAERARRSAPERARRRTSTRRAGAARVVAALVVAFAALVALAPAAWAKSFSIPSLQTDATVQADGSMTVVEHVTYDFDGTFNHLNRTFASGAIEAMVATEGERTLAVEEDGSTSGQWQWAIPNSSGRHTYTLSYRVAHAVKVGSDVGELEWQFVGTDTSVVIGRVDVAITMPGDGTDLRAWAHGPLNGTITIDGPLVKLAVNHLPAHTFVEAHVVEPADNFTVSPGASPLLPQILATESALADQANRVRADARAKLDRRHALEIATPFVLAVALVAFLAIWWGWGREPAVPDDIGDYWRDVPADRPAVGRSLLDFGGVDAEGFSATVVDLAQRGYLRISETRRDRLIGRDQVDYRFDALRHTDLDGLTSWERSVMQRLFDGTESSTQEDLTTWARSTSARRSRSGRASRPG